MGCDAGGSRRCDEWLAEVIRPFWSKDIVQTRQCSMGFLDNLENNLKALESQEQRADEVKRTQQQRDAERAVALAAAPHAERLKSSAFTDALLAHATRLGFAQRVKVHIAWIGTTLRLEARDKKLELRPEATGIAGVYLVANEEVKRVVVDLDGDAEALARSWLGEAA